jgi:hypothetical protein
LLFNQMEDLIYSGAYVTETETPRLSLDRPNNSWDLRRWCRIDSSLGLYKALTEGMPNPQYLITTVGILAFAAVFFGGVWGMAMRKPWGRWLGVAGLTILLIAAAVTQTSRWLSGIDRESGFVSIGLFFRVLVVLGLAFLAYQVAAGDAAEEFFNGRSTEVPQAVREDSDT